MHTNKDYDLVIIGAGVSGAAQAYAAATYSDIKRIAVIEKEPDAGAVNSAAWNNSQTLHEGDIETNYNLEKAKSVKFKSSFTRHYIEKNKSDRQGELYVKGPKMVLGVGEKEVKFLNDRFATFKDLYPTLQQVKKEELTNIELALVKGRDPQEEILALYNEDGLTIDYGLLAKILLEDARCAVESDSDRTLEVYFGTKVESITQKNGGYRLRIGSGEINARYLSVCAGAHSMYFAKLLKLKEVAQTSLLLVAGNFYYTPKFLNAKVYTVQNPKLPFSAVHGDPDIMNLDTKTRYGPTTRVVVQLERHRWNTFFEYLATLSPVFGSILAYARIMLDVEFFLYAVKHNVLFLIPGLGNYLFVKEARKIIPAMKVSDLERAKGQGGVRPQIVRTTEKSPLNLGEAKLAGHNVRFNVTPSPGATTCIYNGLVDVKEIAAALGNNFKESRVVQNFGQSTTAP